MFFTHHRDSSQQNRQGEQEFAEAARESSSLLGNDNLKKRHEGFGASEPKDEEDEESQNMERTGSFLSSKEFNYVVLGCAATFFLIRKHPPMAARPPIIRSYSW